MAKYYFILLLIFVVCHNTDAQTLDEPEKTRFYYGGILDQNEHVQLNMHIENYEIVGAFIIETTGQHYLVHGRLAKDKSGIGLWVYDGKDYIAAIEARVISDEKEFGKTLQGVYKPVDQKKQDLSFEKIAEFAINGKLSNGFFGKII